MTSLGAAVLMGFILMSLLLDKKHIPSILLSAMLVMPQALSVTVLNVNFFPTRILELVLLSRFIVKGWGRNLVLGSIDKVFLGLFIYTSLVFPIHSSEGVVYQIGMLVDAAVCYLIFRVVIADIYEYKRIMRTMAWVWCLVGILAIYESYTRSNPISEMGGFFVDVEAWSREGRLRCQGGFQHPSLFGSVAAGFLCLYMGMICNSADRRIALLGALSCLVVIWATNSGGPLTCALVVFTGWGLWMFRAKIRMIGWVALAALGIASLFMKASIWYLPAKLSTLTGGDGWHRSYLMDAAWGDLGKWFAFGMDLSKTATWFPYYVHETGAADITNQYLRFGLAGGLVSMGLFLLFLLMLWKRVRMLLASASSPAEIQESSYIAWSFGVVLSMHMLNWIGISYFDQSNIAWYFQASAIVSLAAAANSSAIDAASSLRQS